MSDTTAQSFPNLIIRASAGSGKTFQLANRYLGLLGAGAEAGQILATTFTRKAAGEILDRVLERLAAAALDEPAAGELARWTGIGALDRRACGQLLQDLTRQLHRLRIATLDSFFAQVARSFSLELGLPPGWQIVDELDDVALRTVAIDEVLRDGDPRDLRTLLNLLTKGEASRRISDLVRATVSDLYELFKETDAEAWTSLPRYKPLDDVKLAEELEALRECLVADGRMAKARDTDYLQAIAGRWQDLISSGLAAKVIDGSCQYYRKPLPDQMVEIYRRLIEHAKAELIGLVALQTKATYDLLERFHAVYQRLKQERRAMRFEDITERVAANSIGRAFAFRLDGALDHLLLDEFQDTSPAQWHAVRPIAAHVTATSAAEQAANSARRTSFFCVGDRKQAIYGWRGGVAEIFDAVSDQLTGLTEQLLNKSYRSSQTVIDTVNRIFTGIAQHPNLDRAAAGVDQWCKAFTVHETARPELPGYARLVAAPAPEENESPNEAALRFAADEIANMYRAAPTHSIGVLVRKNDTVARLIYQLRRRAIPASEEGGHPLTDSAAVNIILSLLRLADHPGHTVARFHVVNSPLAETLGVRDHADHLTAFQLSQRLRGWLLADGYGPTIYRWARELAAHLNRRELSRLGQLVKLAYAYPGTKSLRVDDFVRYVETQRVADPSAANVRVMTIHQAKGLQFDVVVLPELDVDIIGQSDSFVIERDSPTAPAKRVCRYAGKEVRELMPPDFQKMFSDAVIRDVNESLCVLYVAVTRAIHALHMIIPPSAKNERSFPRKFSGLLRVALRDTRRVEPNDTVFEAGDRHWHRKVIPPASLVESMTLPEGKSLQVKLAPVSEGRRRGLQRTSPSMLEGGTHVSAANLFDIGGDFARQRGTLIHSFFEQIHWLDDGLPEPARLEQLALDLPDVNLPAGQVRELIAEFQSMLANPEVAGLLSRSNYPADGELSVENERRIAYRQRDQIITGSIDRLVVQSQRGQPIAAHILDFKTDALPPGDAAALKTKVDHYRPQIAAYRQAVAAMYSLSPDSITARLVFVTAGTGTEV